LVHRWTYPYDSQQLPQRFLRLQRSTPISERHAYWMLVRDWPQESHAMEPLAAQHSRLLAEL